MTTMDAPALHAHLSTASVDCDGPMYHDWIMSLSEAEIAEHREADGVNDFHDIHFKERVLAGLVSFHPLQSLRVEITEHGIECHETTDEGHRHAEARWCTDEDCDPDTRSQRDVYAEMAGY